MPSNLSNAVPTGILPQTFSTAFSESRTYPLLYQQQNDGSVIRSIIQDGINAPVSLRTWSLTKRLLPADLLTLRTFYYSVNGSLGAFYFYDPYDASTSGNVGSNYDHTGVSTEGRYVCQFTTLTWSEIRDLSRTTVSISFRSIA